MQVIAAMRPAVKNAAKRKIHVMIVDDHLVVREGLAVLIEQTGDMAVCASVGTPEEAMTALAHSHPDVIVLDLALGSATGLDLISSILTRYPGMKILALSMYHERLYAERVLRMGASGYIMKSEGHAKVIEGIHEVMAGRIYVSDAMREQIWHRFLARGLEDQLPNKVLTDRELEVFHLLGQGLMTKEIAHSLQVSAKTIQTYRNNIKQKLNIQNAAELIHQATLWAHNEHLPAGKSPKGRESGQTL